MTSHGTSFLGGAAVAVAAGLLVQPPTSASSSRQQIVVSAASSMAEVLGQAARLWERGSGDRVVVNAAASNTLARQIIEGAPVDLFVSADEAQMDLVEAAGRLEPGTRVKLVSNQLAVLVPADRLRRLGTARDLLDASFRRIAIADPSAVPAGVYARRYLESLGLWKAIQPRIIPTTNVRAAVAAVESGDADAAFAYVTDARAAPRAAIALTVPRELAPPIVYPAAVVRGSRHADAARRFLAFLKGPDGQAILERAGFVPLPEEIQPESSVSFSWSATSRVCRAERVELLHNRGGRL